MNDNEEEDYKQNKRYAISKIDYILQIRLEELKSDKEAATSYSTRYREVANSFERKIFASAAAVVSLSTAIFVFNVIKNLHLEIPLVIFALLALVIAAIAEWLHSQHQKRTADLWFELDGKYGLAISKVNEQRVSIASISDSRMGKVNSEQLFLLIHYTALNLREYRAAIMDTIHKIFNNICLEYIERRLVHLWDRQDKTLNEANENVDEIKDDFQTLSDLLELKEELSDLVKRTRPPEFRTRLENKGWQGAFCCLRILRSHGFKLKQT